MNHIDDLAEFYALGDLTAAEKMAVEQHVVTCEPCLRKLGQAEEMVLALEQQYAAVAPPRFLELGLNLDRRAPTQNWWWVVAAAFALGLLPSMFAWMGRSGSNDTNLAAIALLHSHFNHSQFAGTGAPPSAKVLYSKDHSWIYVMVEGNKHYDVYAVKGTLATKVGAISPEGSTSNLFVQNPGALDGVELRDGSTVIERAQVR